MITSRGWVLVGGAKPLAQEVLLDSCSSAPLPLRFLPPDFQALQGEGACPRSTAAPLRASWQERRPAPRLLAGELAGWEQPLALVALATTGARKCAAGSNWGVGRAEAKQAALQRLLLARLRALQLELAEASQAALAARAEALQAAMAAWPPEVLQLELADAFQAALRRLMLAGLLVLQLELADALQAAQRRLLLARARTAVALRAALRQLVLEAAGAVAAAARRHALRLQLAERRLPMPATVSESCSEYPCFCSTCPLARADDVLQRLSPPEPVLLPAKLHS